MTACGSQVAAKSWEREGRQRGSFLTGNESLEVPFLGLFLNPPLNKNSRCLLLPERQSPSSDKSLISFSFITLCFLF